MEDNAPNDGKKDDLYLKGEGYDSKGKTVNFGEKIDGDGGRVGMSEHRWRLTAFESGTTQLGELGGGTTNDGGYADDDITCDGGRFEVTAPTDEVLNKWEKAVADVKFKLSKCSTTGGRRECDIEIEDTVGLKDSSS